MSGHLPRWLDVVLRFVYSACATAPEDEGLVLKNPEGKLTVRNNNWSVKCRQTHENYSF